jgi:hypothetical protein
MDVSTEVKRELINGRLQLWRNTLYAAMLDAKVAQKLVDAKLERGETAFKQAKDQVKECEVAIEELERELSELG